jgi:hypothetical protein
VNQFFAIPSLDSDEAAETIADAIKRHDPDATIRFDLRARMARVASVMRAETLAKSIAAAGHTVSSWVEELPGADSVR